MEENKNSQEKPFNVWDKSVKVEENSYYWKGNPIIIKGKPKNNDKPIVAEFFCGCGGTSIGFEMAGYQVVLGCDILQPAIGTFRTNHPDVSTILGDLRKVTEDQVLDILGGRQVDVMIGGAPCQGFSISNRKRNEEDERNFLFKEYCRFLKAVKPKAFVFENVSGMKSMGDFSSVIETELAKASGLKVKSKLLFAPDYGVPQSRTRLLFIGTQDGFDFDDIIKTNGPTTQKPYNTVRDAIGDLPSLLPNESSVHYKCEPFSDYQKLMRGDVKDGELTCHRSPNHPASVVKMIEQTKQGEPMYKKFKQRIRLSWDSPSPTQVSGGIRPSFQFGHPEDARGLTIRERCRIQSFPDNFFVCGGIVQGRVQTGNAVPPLLAKAIGLALKKYIK